MAGVRLLTEADAALYHPVRLRALREHPEAFGSAYEDELTQSLETVAGLIAGPDVRTFGAFVDDALVGLAGVYRSPRVKLRHRAIIWGMYVAPEARGKGLGQALLEAVIAAARSFDGVRDVVLAVTVGNESARRLYVAAGFVMYSVDPRYIQANGRFYDLEWMILPLVV